MSEHEPTYLVLDWNEDFKLDAHVDSAGQQRFAVTGYIEKQRADGLYRAPLIPELFFGVNGEQLDTWSQNLTVGDHTVLRRDSGNPYVPDSELNWTKVPQPNRQAPQQTQQSATRVATMDLTLPIFILVGTPIILYAIYRLWWHKK